MMEERKLPKQALCSMYSERSASGSGGGGGGSGSGGGTGSASSSPCVSVCRAIKLRSASVSTSTSSQLPDVTWHAVTSLSLFDVLRLPGNNKCADCGLPDPHWASTSFGVFICDSCADIHRRLETRISRVVSVTDRNQWSTRLVQLMESRGNNKAALNYEQLVPVSYRRPKPTDPLVLREEWIRGKYEREDFKEHTMTSPSSSQSAGSRPCDRYQAGRREGYLWKRGRDKRKFCRRWFVLDELENTLRYYNKQQTVEPKGTFRLDGLNVALIPHKLQHPNAMQLTYEVSTGKTRNIFVFASSGQEMVEWYSCIRWLKMQRLMKTNPAKLTVRMLSTMLSRDFMKEGWLLKTGPRTSAPYRRRWFTLDARKLRYHKDTMEAYSCGEIVLGMRCAGFFIQDGSTQDTRRPPSTGFAFTLTTPWRRYCFVADTEAERQEWKIVISSALD